MSKDLEPTIVISLKRPTIRINKETLQLLGNPSHILLSINPTECSLIILPTNRLDSKALNISKNLNKNSISLYSTFLVNQLKKICDVFDGEKSYKIFGEYMKSNAVVKFDMKKAVGI